MHGSFERTSASSQILLTPLDVAKLADIPNTTPPRLLTLLDLAEKADPSLNDELNLSAAWGPSVGDDIPSMQIYP